jgi:hypothetical protein
MLKKDSEAWRLAKAIARRKGVMWRPVSVHGDGGPGDFVYVESLITGNGWTKTISQLRALFANKEHNR